MFENVKYSYKGNVENYLESGKDSIQLLIRRVKNNDKHLTNIELIKILEKISSDIDKSSHYLSLI